MQRQSALSTPRAPPPDLAVTSAQSQPASLEAGPSRSANPPRPPRVDPLPPRESSAPPPPPPPHPESPLTAPRAESPDLDVLDNDVSPPAVPDPKKRVSRPPKSKAKGKEVQADADENSGVRRTTRRRQGT